MSPPTNSTVPIVVNDAEAAAPPYSVSAPDRDADHGIPHDDEEVVATGSAQVRDDGRVDLDFGGQAAMLAETLMPSIQESSAGSPPPSYDEAKPVPKLNIVIQIVGTRGDVQPFIALGYELKKFGHRIRIATHPVFKKFVESEGMEFFSISGDPNALMAFMVKNPSLMPTMDSVRKGDISNRRREIEAILQGCWRSCIEGGDGMSDVADETEQPFIADVIIANPPSFAHVHIAERLGIPVHMMFTMPWTPTQSFPHPLAKIKSKEEDSAKANRMSYLMMEMMTWQGVGDLINDFREKTLGLDSMGPVWASTVFQRLHTPFTYCWSPALIPKPADWGARISISGFFFVSAKSSYQPPPELAQFLASGSLPMYIGFGSIVIDDPAALTKIIFEAVKQTGVRAIVSRGSAGLGAEVEVPDDIFLLGDCPHSWLFNHVSAVMHHGGAGTTAAGIATGNPTIIVPFFGDQHFWGKMIARAGGGPEPIEYKDLTVEKLVSAIKFALKPETRHAAADFKARIDNEDGAASGAQLFHQELPRSRLHCDLLPERPAVWTYKKKGVELKLSAVAGAALVKEGLLRPDDLVLYRVKEYRRDPGPWDPVTGRLTSTMNHLSSMAKGYGNITWGLSSKAKEVVHNPSLITSELKTKASENTKLATPSTSTEVSRTHSLETTTTATSDASKLDKSISKSSKNSDRVSRGFSELASGMGRSYVQRTLFVSQGLNNLPLLYGDKTVRPSEKVTGIQSGLKAAGMSPFLGFYDGFSGLITQPIQGGKEDGAVGVLKGVGKGIAGLVIKPVAGIHGTFGYLNKGMLKESQKKGPKEVKGKLRSGRLTQGTNELRDLREDQKQEILKGWRESFGETR